MNANTDRPASIGAIFQQNAKHDVTDQIATTTTDQANTARPNCCIRVVDSSAGIIQSHIKQRRFVCNGSISNLSKLSKTNFQSQNVKRLNYDGISLLNIPFELSQLSPGLMTD